MTVLGVDPSKPWRYRDHSRSLGWGRNRSLQRIHSDLGDILALSKTQDLAATQEFIVQLLKAVLQATLDGSDLRTASLLLPTPDPLQRREFGASEAEVQSIAEYRKALYKLRRMRSGLAASPADAYEDDEN